MVKTAPSEQLSRAEGGRAYAWLPLDAHGFPLLSAGLCIRALSRELPETFPPGSALPANAWGQENQTAVPYGVCWRMPRTAGTRFAVAGTGTAQAGCPGTWVLPTGSRSNSLCPWSSVLPSGRGGSFAEDTRQDISRKAPGGGGPCSLECGAADASHRE